MINDTFSRKPDNVSLPIHHRISLANLCTVFENAKEKYNKLFSKMNISSAEIRYISSVHTVFLLLRFYGFEVVNRGSQTALPVFNTKFAFLYARAQ